MAESLDFLNQNSLINYPIKEGSSRLDSSGVFTIPNTFLVDAKLAVSSNLGRRYYISKLSNFSSEIGLDVSDDTGALVGSFVITVSTHTRYATYQLIPTNTFTGAAALIVVGNLTNILDAPSGVYNFSLSATELEPRVAVPTKEAVARITFRNPDGTTYSLSGDVIIDARVNLRFKAGTGNRVVLDAGEGLGLNTLCANVAEAIKTINGIPPDEDGNFTLDFSDCALLSQIPAGTGLLLEDTCCKPCMGCNDIEELTRRLMELETNLLNLRDFYNGLDVKYNEFKTITEYTCDCPTE